ncbi:DMT family transporter, partial [Patescibacteria group bacterium]|nr:DMT family transporter [Patescibacteria group bacterium]
LILLATLLWAGESVLSKYLLTDLPARIVIWGRMFFGSVFILLFWLLTCLSGRQAGQFALAFSLNSAQIGWIAVSSVLLFGYAATWYSGLKYVKVSAAAAILLLGSPITTLLSLAFLGEQILVSQTVGIILTLAAAVLIFKLSSRYVQEKSARAV